MNKVLCNSLIYDDGTKVGIAVDTPDAKLHILNTTEDIGIYTEGLFAGIEASGDSVGGMFDGYEAGVFGSGDIVGGMFEGSEAGGYGFADGEHEFVFGMLGEAENATSINAGLGGRAIATVDSSVNVGVFGTAENSDFVNAAIEGLAHGASAVAVNAGIIAGGQNSGFENYGGYFKALGDSGVNYGVWSKSDGTDTNSYAGYFDGDVTITGTLYNPPSDRKLKDNVEDIEDALTTLSQLQPKDFDYKTSDYPYMHLPQGRQHGLIAQEMEQVLPGLVKTITNPEQRDGEGNVLSPQVQYKGINYIGLIPLLVSSINEQQEIIDSLSETINDRLAALESTVTNCCDVGFRNAGPDNEDEGEEMVNHMSVELSTLQVVVLEQNVPNPFKEQTSISYFIPEDAGIARIIFFDIMGRKIKTVDVEKDYGIMTVFAQNLSSGQYTYSLVVDGKVMETKRMMKTK